MSFVSFVLLMNFKITKMLSLFGIWLSFQYTVHRSQEQGIQGCWMAPIIKILNHTAFRKQKQGFKM